MNHNQYCAVKKLLGKFTLEEATEIIAYIAKPSRDNNFKARLYKHLQRLERRANAEELKRYHTAILPQNVVK